MIRDTVAVSGSRSPVPGTILVDFDGTISTVDVGNRLFHRITGGAWKEVVDQWKQGTVSSRQCMIHECSLARATREEVLAFALEQPLDPTFPPFLEWAESLGWRVRVVSDGLDVYIRAILGREGLGRLPVEANRAVFAGDRILPAFPFAARSCGRCGNCKGGAVDEAREHGPVVFIGDGLSDRCGAERADRVFTREGKDLQAYCRDRSIEHHPFRDFTEVRRVMETRRALTGDPS